MYTPLQLAAKYIRYYFRASNGKGHGIHSPFVFNFITRVLNDKQSYAAYQRVEECRQRLLKDKRLVPVADFGAGSGAGNQTERTVHSIARNAAKPPKLAQLLFRIAQHYQPQTILELGTSLGISAAYLALGQPAARVVTCEGAPAIARLAKENFSSLGIKNITVENGRFDELLPSLLPALGRIDLAFIDGNHRRLPTLQYFEMLLQQMAPPAILIFDDIHWSQEMEAAWEIIKAHPAAMMTVDLFFVGLVFLNSDFKIKQHFVIRF